jgi:hypothetical protein
MEITTSTWMLIFFLISLVASIWKIYAFLPNKALEDDDTTQASQEELLNLVLHVIKNSDGNLTSTELYEKIKSNEKFNTKHFWRFNLNKLNQLLNHYYLENPDTKSIRDIYQISKKNGISE